MKNTSVAVDSFAVVTAPLESGVCVPDPRALGARLRRWYGPSGLSVARGEAEVCLGQ
jgi:hypothetical protein